MQIQEQIYLIIGIAGSFSLIFFTAILIICGLLCVFRRDITELKRINRERYAFNNPTIQPGEELSVRGFQMIQLPSSAHSTVVKRNNGGFSGQQRSVQSPRSSRSLDYAGFSTANEKPGTPDHFNRIETVSTEDIHEAKTGL